MLINRMTLVEIKISGCHPITDGHFIDACSYIDLQFTTIEGFVASSIPVTSQMCG